MIKKILFIFLFSLSISVFANAGLDDGYTVSLLHFNKDLRDESGKQWTALGNATVSASISKFGGGALYLDGVPSYTYIICNQGLTDFDFGNGSFTVDWWEYSTANVLQVSIARSVEHYPPWGFGYIDDNSAAQYFSSNGVSWDM